MPATDKNLEFGIELEADRLVNSFIRREDLVKEMTVVRNEFEIGENNPSSILSQRMMAVAFEWHNYGKSTIGNRADIERVPIERLQAFYKKYYQPDNVVLIVAGKFDEKPRRSSYVSKYFGTLKAPEPRARIRPTPRSRPRTASAASSCAASARSPVVGLMYHIPAAAHEDHPAVEVLSMILGDDAVGPAVQGARRDQEGDRGQLRRHDLARSGHSRIDRERRRQDTSRKRSATS